MIVAMLSYSRSHNRCKIQKLLTVYFKACGLATKGFDTLHALGVSMSQKWAYDGIDQLALASRAALLEDIRKYRFFGGHDNLNVPFRVYEQRLDSKSHFDSGTLGTIIVVKNESLALPSNDIIQAHKSAGEKRPIKFADILRLEAKAQPDIRLRAIHRVLGFLLHADPFNLATYEGNGDPLFAPPPPIKQLPTGPEHKTCQYMLDTVHIDESSYDGNDRVMHEWFRQLKLDSVDEKKKTARERYVIWVGDQLTVARLRGLRRFRCEDINPWEQMSWLEERFGYMHAEVALEHSFHDQYYLTSSGVGLKRDFDILGRKNLSSPSVKGTFHHDMREALRHIAEARFRDLWCVVGGADKIEDLRAKSTLR